MRFYIDRFYKICGTFIVKGWCECYRPGDSIDVFLDDVELRTLTSPAPNLTLLNHFGEETEAWGFHVTAVFPDELRASTQSVRLRFPNGFVINSIGSASPRLEDQEAHGVYWNFVNEIRAQAGVVLELGSRARSGVSSRGTYDPARHIGFDIVAGDNVDIVDDVHQLSRLISDPVDSIVSISVFEHLAMPWKAVLEMNKVLRIGGRVYTQSHQAWPLHDVPHDYFRFSDQAWHSLFNENTGFKVLTTKQAHLVTQTAQYNVGPPFDDLEYGQSFGMSVCLAEKTGAPQVDWNASMPQSLGSSYNY